VVERASPGGPGASFAGRVREALATHPPRRLPEEECDFRAAVTLLLAPAAAPPGAGGADPSFDVAGVAALFVHRARVDGDPWSGHIALPGGRSDPADRDLLGTALREMREETGIVLEPREVLGRLDELHPRTSHLPSIGITPFVAWLSARPEVELNHELAGHLWIPVADLASPEHRSLLLRESPTPRRFPTIEYAGAVIWGLTFAVVDDFLSRLGLRPPGPPPEGLPG
jgi:8-oxo-dGTP pyrophosphatase MutT (NUDIX family)